MNSKLARLQPYPFQKLAELVQGVTPPADKAAISLAIGEPKHAAPPFVLEELQSALAGLSAYPATKGGAALRKSVADWASRRFALKRIALDPDRHVLPVCGTREALFSVAQAVIDVRLHTRPRVIIPNPFYQIYEGAALLAGAEPFFLNATADTGYKMDFARVPEDLWKQVQLVYVCSPANPTGAVMEREDYARLIALAEEHDFIIASDECYSEIYQDEGSPPVGLLQVADELGVEDYRRCLVFHSLSKRSNLPGLRSGFVAGDGEVMARYLLYRTYAGSSLPPPTQAASIKAWGDEAHVRTNRDLYRQKFQAVTDILAPVMSIEIPPGGFYLWPQTPIQDETFTRELYARENVLVLPGSYLSREAAGTNPGSGRVRMALVAGLDECAEAAHRVRRYIESL